MTIHILNHFHCIYKPHLCTSPEIPVCYTSLLLTLWPSAHHNLYLCCFQRFFHGMAPETKDSTHQIVSRILLILAIYKNRHHTSFINGKKFKIMNNNLHISLHLPAHDLPSVDLFVGRSIPARCLHWSHNWSSLWCPNLKAEKHK